MPTCEAARERLCDPSAEVSAHWLVAADGNAEQLVDEEKRAWHAGQGEWGGRDDVNSRSIGIELANDGASPFTQPQMRSLERVLAGVMQRWTIRPAGVIAHSDMAPARKSDPGPRFDWRRLAFCGLSVWPASAVSSPAVSSATASARPDPEAFLRDLRAFGYPHADLPILLRAFRLRFRPWHDGPLDARDAAAASDLARRFPVDAGAARA